MKILFKPILAIFGIQFFLSCAIDIRQVPPIRSLQKESLIQEKEPIFLRKFDIYLGDREIFLQAWKASFKHSLKNNHSYLEIFDSTEDSITNKNLLILDIEIYPKLKDEYNWWLTWPAAYPLSGWWPLQIRNADYEVEIRYVLYKNNKVLKQENRVKFGSHTVFFYGFFRTIDIEKMIELTNLGIIDECAKAIASSIQ